jgi:glycosyltransferase involved in cell wall biosynthesis
MRTSIISDLWQPFPGGAERYMANLADALAERGHEIHILTSYAKAKSRHPMTIKSIPTGVLGSEMVARFIDEHKPDLLISHHYFAGEFGWMFSLDIPAVEIIHNRQRSVGAKLAVFNSRYTADRCGFREGDMIILPPAGADVMAEYPGRLCTTNGFIGHIKPIPNRFWKGQWYGKGVDLTYRLARIMPERKFLVLRGEWQDVEYIEHLPNVEFMEPVDDIREFYARCRLVVMPSGSEDAGTCCQEAAINGIPAISSNVGGLPETNAGGILLCPHDIRPWIREIVKLDNREYYDEIVRRQRLAIATMSWAARFDELDAKLRVICGK